MNCRRIRKNIIDYMSGTLSKEKTERIKEHLLSCAECSQLIAELEATSHLVRSLDRAKAPAGFESRLQTRIAFQQSVKTNRNPIRRFARDFARAFIGMRRLSLRPVIAGILFCIMLGVSILMIINNNVAQATDQAFISVCQEQHISFAAANPLADDSAVLLKDRASDLANEL
ncbi:MAG: zf-HC2 domain-containing protein [Armatimonadetes bacterium]|nr:zf-HC2 domain-containing protein [Armatimonadota bacterium]